MLRASYRKTMALTDIVGNVKSFGRDIGKYVAISSAIASLYMSAHLYAQNSKVNNRVPTIRKVEPFWSPQRVEEIKRNRKITGGKYIESNVASGPNTISIDSSWTFVEINNVMDGDSGTKGHNNISDPLPYSGDTILFTTGTYQTPADSNASFRNYIPGIIIQGQADTFLQNDPQVSSGAVFRNFAVDVIINGLTIQNSKFGILDDGNLNPNNPNYITGNNFKNLYEATTWNNKNVAEANTTASITEDSNVYESIFLGTIHSTNSNPTSSQTAFKKFSNNSGKGISALWYGPVKYFSATSGSGPIYLGPSLADGNAMIDSNGVFMPADVYTTGGFAATSNVAVGDIPDANLEYNVALNTDPSYPYGGSLESTVGGLNIVANPMLSIHGRPLPGSPLIGDGMCKKLDGTERHFCGASNPAGDYNLNGLVDDFDQTEFWRVMNKNNAGLTTHERETFDFTNDNLVNDNDVGEFYKTFQGVPTIPAVSTWGLGISAILLATAGTLLLRRKGRCACPESS